MFLEILLSMLGNWARSLILWLSSHPLYLLLREFGIRQGSPKGSKLISLQNKLKPQETLNG